MIYIKLHWYNNNNCLKGMLLVSRSGFVEENDVQELYHYGIHLSYYFFMQDSKSF